MPFFYEMKLKIGEIVLNYDEIEPQNRQSNETVLLFLHEALGSIGQWKSFPQQLCNELGLDGIVYERQGHGNSSPFTEARTERYLHNYAFEELPEFIESVIPKNKTILLIGHSDGGTIALLYSSKFPTRISGLVTMAAHVINEPETIAGIQPAIEAYQEGKLVGLKKYHAEKTHALFFAWANIWCDEGFNDWNIVPEIGSELPGLFIQGADDQYGTAQQLELIESKFPNGRSQLIKACGHHPHLEQTQHVLSIIKTWHDDWFS